VAINPWQALRQVAYRLVVATWPDAPNDLILTGGAVVSRDKAGNFRLNVGMDGVAFNFMADGPPALATPYAKLVWIDGTLDPDVPGRYLEPPRIRVGVIVGKGDVAADPLSTSGAQTHGQDALLGSALGADGQGGSVGRGVEETLNTLIQRALNDGSALNYPTHGFQGYVDRVRELLPIGGVKVIERTFDVLITDAVVDPQYAPVRLFTGTIGGGVATLTWKNPATRFDSLTATPIVRKLAGATAPATPGAGAGVAVTPGAETTTDAEAPGQWSYAAFVPYDESMPGPPTTANRYSAAATKTLTF